MTAATDCLERTRSAVLNVLIVTGTGIALSGWLLRWRDGWALFRAPRGVGQGLMVGLVVVAVASFAVRRLGAASNPGQFYRRHVVAASLAALAVPLGLAYGWLIRPRLDVVGPFWVVALALGFLALPRAHELQGLDRETDDTGP